MTARTQPPSAGSSRADQTSPIADARRQMYCQVILAAAEIEFGKRGYADTKMADIVTTSGLSLATIYKHFAGKSQIWDELHSVRMTALLGDVEQAIRVEGPTLDRLLAGVAAVAGYLTTQDAYLDMSLRAGTGWTSAGEGRGVERTVWGSGLGMITEGISTAIERGEMQQIRPAIAAGMVVSALQIWLTDWVANGRDRSPEVVIAELITHLRWMLVGPSRGQ